MATFKIKAERVSSGTMPRTSLQFCTTKAQVNQEIAGKDVVSDTAEVSEAQLQGIMQYIRACATGLTTTSIETAIAAVI